MASSLHLRIIVAAFVIFLVRFSVSSFLSIVTYVILLACNELRLNMRTRWGGLTRKIVFLMAKKLKIVLRNYNIEQMNINYI